MSDANPHPIDYTRIWYWLVGLAAVSVGASAFHLPGNMAAALIFGIATWKALLVAGNYMHLKQEGPMIYIITLAPIVLVLILVLLLVPDFVLTHGEVKP